jgi:hypothetical protein
MKTAKNTIDKFDSRQKVWLSSLSFILVILEAKKTEMSFVTEKTIYDMTEEDYKEMIEIAKTMRAEVNKISEMLNYLAVMYRDCGLVGQKTDITPQA